ncbi:hypothetical protein F5144DRAFT_552526 [Chaetomium tenue]|uniref:Uncharacterized protein n=1 Tax=Chaetomium tenue TaxID=1854479 RepID=A0ACB7PJN2_9PEZI|nr:hypothetical protein F5144DRAFT_552526 [Chaetomium globosum]
MAVVLSFGGKSLDALYNETGSRDHVFDYLQSVIDNYDKLDPPIKEDTKNELVVIKTQIELLSLPSGDEYMGKGLALKDPESTKLLQPQHIRREVDTVWENDTKKASVKKKNGLSLFKLQAEAAKGHHWAVYTKDSKRPYWNQYDLLGLFFSKMGPAPGGDVADQSKFYLPLTAVYAKFCLWIGGKQIPSMKDDPEKKNKKGDGQGDPPAVFQCTWNSETGDFFLGATLAGDRSNGTKLEYGAWEDKVKKARWDLLANFFIFPGDWGPFEGGRSPAKELDKKTTLFGNCGETYPFLEMMGPHVKDTDRARMRGLALGKAFASVPLYEEQKFFNKLIPPCMSCQQLMVYAGIASVNQFTQDATMDIPLFPYWPSSGV